MCGRYTCTWLEVVLGLTLLFALGRHRHSESGSDALTRAIVEADGVALSGTRSR